jgi:hypothetical protein
VQSIVTDLAVCSTVLWRVTAGFGRWDTDVADRWLELAALLGVKALSQAEACAIAFHAGPAIRAFGSVIRAGARFCLAVAGHLRIAGRVGASRMADRASRGWIGLADSRVAYANLAVGEVGQTGALSIVVAAAVRAIFASENALTVDAANAAGWARWALRAVSHAGSGTFLAGDTVAATLAVIDACPQLTGLARLTRLATQACRRTACRIDLAIELVGVTDFEAELAGAGTRAGRADARSTANAAIAAECGVRYVATDTSGTAGSYEAAVRTGAGALLADTAADTFDIRDTESMLAEVRAALLRFGAERHAGPFNALVAGWAVTVDIASAERAFFAREGIAVRAAD